MRDGDFLRKVVATRLTGSDAKEIPRMNASSLPKRVTLAREIRTPYKRKGTYGVKLGALHVAFLATFTVNYP